MQENHRKQLGPQFASQKKKASLGEKIYIPWVNIVWETHYSDGRVPSNLRRGSFWWSDILKLIDKFKGMAIVSVSDGKSILFWEDLQNDMIPKLNYPEQHSFAKNRNITMEKVLTTPDLTSLFSLPVSEEAFSQLGSLSARLDDLNLSQAPDRWSYIWGSPQFSASRAYKSLSGHSEIHSCFHWLSNSSCQLKHKVFFWLLLMTG